MVIGTNHIRLKSRALYMHIDNKIRADYTKTVRSRANHIFMKHQDDEHVQTMWAKNKKVISVRHGRHELIKHIYEKYNQNSYAQACRIMGKA